MKSVLVVSGIPGDAEAIRGAFASDFRIARVSDYPAALARLKTSRFDIVFLDITPFSARPDAPDFTDLLNPLKNLHPGIEVVVLSSPESVRRAVQAVKSGASDYLTRPISAEEAQLVLDTLKRRVLHQSELEYLRDQFWRGEFQEVVHTRNTAMNGVFEKIKSVAPTKTTVLLTGETGTGKGLMARLIHLHSNRHQAQFISVHCGAVPETLLESELFGHEKGSFTGAFKRKLGKFEIAKGGTIFLDEIGTITPAAQIKLLQVLQDGTFSRVGGDETIQTSARVIAATNENLSASIGNGSFRKDLFYRLNVFPIEIPPLRDRLEDLPYLAGVVLKRLHQEFQGNIEGIDPQVLTALSAYDWPGNIRELENLLERAYILEKSRMLTPESFPVELIRQKTPTAVVPLRPYLSLNEARHQAIENFERLYLKELMQRNRGRINRSAEEAGISTRQLHKLLTKHGIRKEEFKR
jgi:DNA-binding NtrC family response regulator